MDIYALEAVHKQFDHFMIVEWRDHYVNREELKRAYKKLNKMQPLEVKIDGLAAWERRIYGAAAMAGQGQEKDGGSAAFVKPSDSPKKKIGGPSERSPLVRSLRGSMDSFDSVSQDDDVAVERALAVFIKNIERVSSFHSEQMDSLNKSLSWLQKSLHRQNRREGSVDLSSGSKLADEKLTADKLHMERESIKRAFIDLYRRVKFLESYDGLNYTLLVTTAREAYSPLVEFVDAQNFAHEPAIPKMLATIEVHFADAYLSGNVTAARTALLLKQTQGSSRQQMNFGIYIGVCLTLMIWLLWDATIDNSRLWRTGTLMNTAAYELFRGIFACILAFWGWGLSAWVWGQYRINFIYMFELDQRALPNVEDIFSAATRVTVVYFVTLLLYFKTVLGTFPPWFRPGIYPLVLVCYLCTLLLFSGGFVNQTMFAAIKVVTAPFAEVTFFSIFIGDWLTSLVKPAVDLAYGVCYFGSGLFLLEDSAKAQSGALTNLCRENSWTALAIVPVISALPLWWRFMQCIRRTYDTGERFPNLLNAAKYSLAMFVVLLGAFHPFDRTASNSLRRFTWILLFCASGLFSFLWDVYMDWGLGRPKYGFLSDTLMYRRKHLYYLAIVVDFFLRFSWVLTLVEARTALAFLSMLPGNNPTYFIQTTILIAEIVRRTMWGFFRLENEHLRNTLHFRSSNFIPLHFDSVYGSDKDSTRDGHRRPGVLELGTLTVLVMAFAVVIVSSHFMKFVN